MFLAKADHTATLKEVRTAVLSGGNWTLLVQIVSCCKTHYEALPKTSEMEALNCLQGTRAVATHSSALAWKIPWTEEPGRLQSMGSLRVRHD